MASSEKFCLRWNDFEANVSGAFREIREEKDFFDVTLACDDNQMEAHKVIISACSPWFRNILRRNPHQHPLLYLKGVKYRELVAVLNFMYQGEVNVAQDDLNSFLSVAEELQVKGLTQGSSSGNNQSKSSSSVPKPEAKATPSTPSVRNVPEMKKPRVVSQAPAVIDDDDIQEVVPVKSEPGAGSSMDQAHAQYLGGDQGAVALEDSYQDEAYDYEGYDDGSAGVIDPNTGLPYAGSDGNKDVESKLIPLGQGRWSCLDCEYVSQKCNVLKHIESRHVQTIQYSCPYCSKIIRGRNAYDSHLYQIHRANK